MPFIIFIINYKVQNFRFIFRIILLAIIAFKNIVFICCNLAAVFSYRYHILLTFHNVYALPRSKRGCSETAPSSFVRSHAAV